MEPYIVQSVTDSDGNVVSYHEPQEVRQVISQETSSLVLSYMESVVNDVGGTGKNAKVDGYRIAGKTGSSQTLTSEDRIIVSFLGCAPADDPEVIVLLGYDWPEPSAPGQNTTDDGIYISGGNMAAPMAGELIANIMDYLGYDKTGSSENENGVTIPYLIGETAGAGYPKRAGLERPFQRGGICGDRSDAHRRQQCSRGQLYGALPGRGKTQRNGRNARFVGYDL